MLNELISSLFCYIQCCLFLIFIQVLLCQTTVFKDRLINFNKPEVQSDLFFFRMQSVIELGRVVRDRKTMPVKYPLPELIVIHKDQVFVRNFILFIGVGKHQVGNDHLIEFHLTFSVDRNFLLIQAFDRKFFNFFLVS